MLFPDNRHRNPSGARTIEFAEIDGLPRSKHGAPILDRRLDAEANEGRFEVAVGISFGVKVAGFLRNEPV